MEPYIAEHPVFGKGMEVVAYELDFRAGFREYCQGLETEGPAADPATFLDFAELTNGKRGVVRFPRDLLMVDFPVLFSKDMMVTGVSADLADDEQVLRRCRFLRDHGYVIAVLGLAPAHVDLPVMELAEYGAVDFSAAPGEHKQAVVSALARRGVQALATNLDTSEAFQEALSLGYTLFEGEFFARPIVRPGREIAPRKLTYLRLLREVNNPALSYDEIATLVEQDVALTYKLLKFMNSAWFGLQFKVSSVKHALVLLGPPEIRRWVSLVAVRSVAEDKPEELLVRSLTRAKGAEQIGWAAGMQREAPELFLMGMLSLMDALTDRPMEDVLAKLPLEEQIKTALLGGTGNYRDVFDAVVAYERGDWNALADLLGRFRIDDQEIPGLMRESLTWAREALHEI